MPTLEINDIGLVGLWGDQPGHSPILSPGALTQGKNVLIADHRLRNFPGRTQYATPPIEVYVLYGFNTKTDETLWLELGLAKAYVYDGATHNNITRQAAAVDVDYTLNEYYDRWTGGAQNDIGALCPGYGDSPQLWAPVTQITKLVDMPYDPQAAPGSQTWKELNYRAFAMRTWKNTILAINVQRPFGTVQSQTVQWCDFLTPNATTTDWVPRSTNSAGELVMSDTVAPLIDGAALRDDFIVYGPDSAWRITQVNTQGLVFGARRLPGDTPQIINRNCIAGVREFHIVAASNDVYHFDGNRFRSILDNRMRETYAANISRDRGLTSFVALNQRDKDVWICTPGPGSQFPNQALVWNYRDDTISSTELPLVRHMNQGVITPQVLDAFDDPPDVAFDQWFGPFNEAPFTGTQAFLVGAHDNLLSVFAESQSDDGTPRECIATRTGIPMGTSDFVKRAKEVRLNMNATAPLFVRMGAQHSPNSSVHWEPEQTFDPRSQYKLNFRADGRFIAYRIRSLADMQWECSGLSIDFDVVRDK